MRILIRLKSEKNSSYEKNINHKVQGFIYSLLKGSRYETLHDKKGYKFFCFSNIFPIGDIKEGDTRNLLISSPDKDVIKFLEEKLLKIKTRDLIVNLSEMQFKIEDASLVKINFTVPSKVITATPIVIRIPKENYDKYGIPEKSRKCRYLFWRPEYAFEAFIKQLEDNLFKKYSQFYDREIEQFPLFEQFRFAKSVCNHIIENGVEYPVIGSVWEFVFNYLNPERRKILGFGLECGFGERNSLGFGFVNIVRYR